jgi:PAS domain S-box-containing protein
MVALALLVVLPLSTPQVQSIIYDLTAVLSVAAVFWGASRREKKARGPWYLIGFGLLAWAIADIVWHAFELVGNGPPSFPAPMDVMYVVGYPVIAVGLLRMSRVTIRRYDNIDSALIAIGLGAVAWMFLGSPYVDAPGYSGLQLAAALAYPLGDALLLGAVVRVLFAGGNRSVSQRLLIASMFLVIIADGFYLQESLLGTYVAGGWIDMGWLLSYVAIGVAALRPSVAEPQTVEKTLDPRLSLGRLSFAICLPILGPALFSAQIIAGVHVNRIVIGLSVLTLFGLSITRAHRVVTSFNQQLTRLDGQNESLEKAFGELKEKEAALSFQARVLDEIESFVVVVGPDAMLTYYNAYAERYFGWTHDDAANRPWTDVFGDIDDGNDVAEIVAGIEETGTWEGDLLIQVKGENRVVRVATSQMHDEFGNRVGVTCIGHDITQGRELEDRLRRVQKLEAFGQLAGGVAHDFNNLLGVVINYAKFLVDDLPEGDSRRDDAQEIVMAGERGASLTRQLLTFSRKTEAKPESLLLNDVVKDIARMLSRTIPENVSFTIELDDDLAFTRVDPGHLEQVIMNLVVNASDAMPDGGNMKLQTRNSVIESIDAAPLGIKPGRYVTFSVSDSGMGMDEVTQARIYEPFFTTKEVGKGTGLGLATVYGIIQEAAGAIHVHSIPGSGTEFTVYLPYHRSEGTEHTHVEVLEPALRGNGEQIIVTEDEEAVRDLVCRMLRRNGYEVVSYASSEQAAVDIESGLVSADLLLTDVVMPGLSGPELAMRAGLPTLLMSGYSNLDAKRIGALPTLAKPFDATELARAVRSALGSPVVAAA